MVMAYIGTHKVGQKYLENFNLTLFMPCIIL